MNEQLSLVFTGHMIDLPDRGTVRFPPPLEPAVRIEIEQSIRDQTTGRSKSSVQGYASLARGGDILFHEACHTLGLRTIIVLPFASARFLERSVCGVPSGRWPERFANIWGATPAEDKHVLGLPDTAEAYAVCNEKILDLARAAGRMHLIALWDRDGGDGPGGTADLVERAKAMGDRPTIIDPQQL